MFLYPKHGERQLAGIRRETGVEQDGLDGLTTRKQGCQKASLLDHIAHRLNFNLESATQQSVRAIEDSLSATGSTALLSLCL